MNPTTFQLARHLNHTRQIVTGQRCPCGNKAVKKDGASWVCAECIAKDQVVQELNMQAEHFYEHARLTGEEVEAAKERQRVREWKARRGKKARSVDITPQSEGAVASSGERIV